jgi:myo-inositol-hexaphosphate 3-phosphohydrolase
MNAVGPALDTVEGLLHAKASDDKIIDAYCAILDGLADFLFASPDAASRALFIARRIMPIKSTIVDSSKGPGSRVHDCCARIIAYLSDGSMGEEECRLIAVSINGQLLTFHFAREHLKLLLGTNEITPERLQTIKQIVRRQTTLLLKSCKRK